MNTLKILGLLLTYPTKPLIAALPECMAILDQEAWLPPSTLRSLTKVIEQLKQESLMDLQEAYVDLFDRTPSLSLHLFEHVYGESRDRGQALVDLAELYREKGLMIATEEMPDFLPLFLEYLAMLPVSEAQANLAEPINVIGAIEKRLQKRGSLYHHVLQAIIEAAGCKPDAKAMEQALAVASGQAQDFDALDALWSDPDVFASNALNPATTGDCASQNQLQEQAIHFQPPLKPQTHASHPSSSVTHGSTL